LRREVWVVPLLVLSSLTMMVIAGFEVFVLCKAWRTTPSRRHLFLGQMLLLGLFLCSVLGAVLAATPTPATCAVVRFGTGFAYAVVFSALLVKCVFLISLNGGVYLPAPYQALLLLFAVLIQVAVGAQWLLKTPPRHHRLLVTAEDIAADHLLLCHTPYTDLLLSLLYVMCLIIFVAVLAIKSRGIRDNYREATFIGLAVGCSIPVWLIWMLCGLVVPERHRDACLAFGLVSTATIVFLVMFMPKGRQLAAMGKEGVYVEDREERFSSLSPAGSGYSPSFFHFKPVKYASGPGTGLQTGALPAHKQTSGVATLTVYSQSSLYEDSHHEISLIQTLLLTRHPNADSLIRYLLKKNRRRANENAKKLHRVALVAAPPSYTRMYHYYPYCYYPRYPENLVTFCHTELKLVTLYRCCKCSVYILNLKDISGDLSRECCGLNLRGFYVKPEDGNLYTTLEPTLSSNPNVFFQRGGVHPGMMY
ncbi:hypothetical protein L798_00948, partial [Zootermopsis nevadensis]